jgi:hypothetical protein
MEHTDDADAFPVGSREDIESAKSLRDGLAVDFRQLLEEQLRQVEDWQNTDKKYTKRLYKKLEPVYTLYVVALGKPRREQTIENACSELKIPNTGASHLSILIVKLLLRSSDKTAYQYAAALRYAARKQIPHDALAKELAKKGHGIEKWAHQFSQEFGTKKRAARSSDSGGGSRDPGDAAAEAHYDNNDNGDDNSHDGYEDTEDDGREKDDAVPDHPEVDWGPNALKIWRKSEFDGGTWLFVKWKGRNRAKIMNKSRPE